MCVYLYIQNKYTRIFKLENEVIKAIEVFIETVAEKNEERRL